MFRLKNCINTVILNNMKLRPNRNINAFNISPTCYIPNLLEVAAPMAKVMATSPAPATAVRLYSTEKSFSQQLRAIWHQIRNNQTSIEMPVAGELEEENEEDQEEILEDSDVLATADDGNQMDELTELEAVNVPDVVDIVDEIEQTDVMGTPTNPVSADAAVDGTGASAVAEAEAEADAGAGAGASFVNEPTNEDAEKVPEKIENVHANAAPATTTAAATAAAAAAAGSAAAATFADMNTAVDSATPISTAESNYDANVEMAAKPELNSESISELGQTTKSIIENDFPNTATILGGIAEENAAVNSNDSANLLEDLTEALAYFYSKSQK